MGNILIIIKTKQANLKPKELQSHCSLINLNKNKTTELRRSTAMHALREPAAAKLMISMKNTDSIDSSHELTNVDFKLNENPKNKSENSSSVISKLLLFTSFSYALLNFPYLITWSLFYNEINNEAENAREIIIQNYLFAAVQFCEIFYVLNYALHFYFYCLSSSKFWKQFKDKSIFIL